MRFIWLAKFAIRRDANQRNQRVEIFHLKRIAKGVFLKRNQMLFTTKENDCWGELPPVEIESVPKHRNALWHSRNWIAIKLEVHWSSHRQVESLDDGPSCWMLYSVQYSVNIQWIWKSPAFNLVCVTKLVTFNEVPLTRGWHQNAPKVKCSSGLRNHSQIEEPQFGSSGDLPATRQGVQWTPFTLRSSQTVAVERLARGECERYDIQIFEDSEVSAEIRLDQHDSGRSLRLTRSIFIPKRSLNTPLSCDLIPNKVCYSIDNHLVRLVHTAQFPHPS